MAIKPLMTAVGHGETLASITVYKRHTIKCTYLKKVLKLAAQRLKGLTSTELHAKCCLTWPSLKSILSYNRNYSSNSLLDHQK